jgi:glyoxylase-like metal-dependent hydrolase (beta-lactamase superfamily II)/trans-aconitate methyltransferase
MKSTHEGRGSAEWYETAFGERYLEVYPKRDAASAEREVTFAVERLDLGPGMRVLDLCCGPGHHLAALRERGIAAVGADLSPELICRARRRGPVARCDMRRVAYAGGFDAVLTFFTTIGYFDDAENALALAEIGRLLAPGGRFLIDYLNPSRVRAKLVPESVREREGQTIVERRSIEESPARVVKHVEVRRGTEVVHEHTERVRLYEPAELTELLARAGLDVGEVHGEFDGTPFAADSRRMILVGKKGKKGKKAGEVPRAPWKGDRPMFKQISVGGDRNFAYLLADGNEAAVVDPILPERVLEAAREAGVEIKYIVNTHGHYDHSDGNSEMKRATGAKLVAHESSGVGADIPVAGGEKFKLGATEFEILHTPGHTRDSICVLWEGKLVTGDTLFVGKVGGTGYGDDARAEYESLHNVIAKLPDDTEVWPGHDVGTEPSSTVGREKETNPFYQQPDLEAFIDLKRNWAAYKRKHGIA